MGKRIHRSFDMFLYSLIIWRATLYRLPILSSFPLSGSREIHHHAVLSKVYLLLSVGALTALDLAPRIDVAAGSLILSFDNRDHCIQSLIYLHAILHDLRHSWKASIIDQTTVVMRELISGIKKTR